jgi:alkanesulfonate monooxygenase SsuD/methylene tetrahydromethanopterin reductase-like flavin-dependent oxidoreductase (luciferase family)
MQFAINVPNFGAFGDARTLSDLAHEAESCGWDGFFIWDHIYFKEEMGELPMADPWVSLGAIAMATERIRFGALVTPLPRRRPWKVAREAVTVDRLSGGRLILGAGIGWNHWGEYTRFGEEDGEKLHAEQLDEALAILVGLWSGEPFSFTGKHYRIEESRFLPIPAQQPRIPIWLAAGYPNQRPLRRAAHWDGVCPISREKITPAHVREMMEVISRERVSQDPFDMVLAGYTGNMEPDEAAALLSSLSAAGATWWQEGFWGTDTVDDAHKRIQQGPPHLS